MATYRLSCECDAIHSVKFNVASNKATLLGAAAEITEATLYNRSIPNSNGVNSLLLGASSRQLRCSTCSLSIEDCPGHTGVHKLTLPCFAPLFFDATLRALRSLCCFCSRPLVLDVEGKDAAALTLACSRSKSCPHCDGPVPIYNKGGELGISRTWPETTVFANEEEERFARREMTPQVALEIFRASKREEVLFLGSGLETLADLVIENLLIPSTAIRPAVSSSTGLRARSQDDITLRLQDCIKRSADLRSEIEQEQERHTDIDARIIQALPPRSDLLTSGPPAMLRKHSLSPSMMTKWARLQVEIFNLVHPTLSRYVSGAPKTSLPAGVSQRRCLMSKLKGKEGRIRGSLLGKRVDHSARSVISPCPVMAIDCVGVPESIATTLTVPIRCTIHNIDSLRTCVLRGAGVVGGASSIIDINGRMISLEAVADKHSVDLRPGCVVERHIVDNDVVIFNRQPTLHRLGMMAHRVQIVEGDTFKLALPVTSCYNADFDGDEMNCHVVQSPCATAELSLLMSVQANAINPKTSRCSFGLVQDALLGVHLLTREHICLSEEFIANAAVATSATSAQAHQQAPPHSFVKGETPYWSGAEALSLALPESFSFVSASAPAWDASVHAALRNWDDTNDDSSLQDFSKLIEASKRPIVVSRGTILLGVLAKKSCGVGGALIDAIARDCGNAAFIQAVTNLQRVAHAHMKQRGFSVGMRDIVLENAEEAERKICERLVFAVENASAVLQAGEERPAVRDAAEATTQQILSRVLAQAADVVQQNVSPSNAFLAMSEAGSKGSKLNLSQISGALGLQIVLGKRAVARQNCRTLPCFSNGETSVNAAGFVQNSYVNGVSPTELFAIAQSGREGLVDTAVKTATSGYLQRTLIKGLEDLVCTYDGTIRNAQGSVVQFAYGNDNFHPTRLEVCHIKTAPGSSWIKPLLQEAMDATNLGDDAARALFETGFAARLPVNADRVLRRFKLAFTVKQSVHVDVDAWRERIQRFAKQTTRCLLLRLHLVMALDSLRPPMLHENTVFTELRDAIDACEVEPGEAVGLLAAQSLGEPATQLTLNSFHSAGTGASGSVLHGVPRLKEILSLAKTPRTPMIRFNTNDTELAEWSKRLASLRLAGLVQEIRVMDEHAISQHAELARAIKIWTALHGGDQQPVAATAVLSLNRSLMQRHAISAYRIADLLNNSAAPSCRDAKFGSFRVVAASAANADEQYVSVSPIIAPETSSCMLHGHCFLTARFACRLTIAGDPRVKSVTVEDDHCTQQGKTISLHLEVAQTESAMAALTTNVLRPLNDRSGSAIPWHKCTPNSVLEVHEMLGVEAAAAVLHKELVETYASGGADDIDQRHVSIVVDCMVRTGVPKPFSRHGLNDKHGLATTGPLVRASFEESVDTLANAALHNEEDVLAGSLSSSIMLGVRPSLGTGAFQVLRPAKANANGIAPKAPAPATPPSAEYAMAEPASAMKVDTAPAEPVQEEPLVCTCVAATETVETSQLGSIAFVSPVECKTDTRLLFSSPIRKRRQRT